MNSSNIMSTLLDCTSNYNNPNYCIHQNTDFSILKINVCKKNSKNILATLILHTDTNIRLYEGESGIYIYDSRKGNRLNDINLHCSMNKVLMYEYASNNEENIHFIYDNNTNIRFDVDFASSIYLNNYYGRFYSLIKQFIELYSLILHKYSIISSFIIDGVEIIDKSVIDEFYRVFNNV